MALDKEAASTLPSHEAKKQDLAALAETKTLAKLFESGDRRRNGNGTCHRIILPQGGNSPAIRRSVSSCYTLAPINISSTSRQLFTLRKPVTWMLWYVP